MKFSLNFSPKLLLLGAAGITLLYTNPVSAQMTEEETAAAVAEDMIIEGEEASAEGEDAVSDEAGDEFSEEATGEIIDEEAPAEETFEEITEVVEEVEADTEEEVFAEEPSQPEKAEATGANASAPAKSEKKRWWGRPY